MSEPDRLLPYLPGPLLATASRALPAAESVTEKYMDVEIVVTVRFERMSTKKGRASPRYFWTADAAEITSMNGEPPILHDHGGGYGGNQI